MIGMTTKTKITLPGDLSKDPEVKRLIKRFDLIKCIDEDHRTGKVIDFRPKVK